MKRTSRIALAFLTASISGTALAGTESGIYIGGSIGSADVEYKDSDSNGNIEFDDSDAGYKAFVGYNLGLVPFLDIAAEVAYVDFGSSDGEINNLTGNSLDTTGWTASGLVGVDVGPIGIFGKVGYFAWDVDIDTQSGSYSDSGSDPAYGVGAKIQLGPVALRAEYEIFELDEVDINYASVGAVLTF